MYLLWYNSFRIDILRIGECMKKKLFLSLSFISLLISFFFIGETYAKYISSVNSLATMTVARWRILVNNNDILNENTASQTITPTFIQNEHIANNVIAPTSTGYFDLIIDSEAADVSFNYKISTSVNEDSAVKDLIVTGYSLNNGEMIEINDPDYIITDDILYSNEEKIYTIRIYIKWDDSDNANMNNADDVAAANKDAKIDVKLNFTQLAS